jgi:hypothetical protein
LIPLKEKPIFNAGVEAVSEYFSGQKVKAKKWNVTAKISPFIPQAVPLEIFSEDLGGIIASYSWAKSRSNPNGRWTLTMAADDESALSEYPAVQVLQSLWAAMGKSLRDIIKPMAYSQLWIDGYHIMSGCVRSFTRHRDSSGRATYTAEFDELGFVYNQEVLDFQTIEQGQDQHFISDSTKIVEAAERMVNTPLPQAIENMVQAFIGSTLSYGAGSFPLSYYRMSDGIPLAARLIALAPPLGGISYSSLVSQYTAGTHMFSGGGSSFWDMLKNMAPEPYMELFTESGGRTICTGRLINGAQPGDIPKTPPVSPGGNIDFSLPGLSVSTLIPGLNYIIARTAPYSNPLLGTTAWDSTLYPYLISSLDMLAAGDFVIVTDDDIISKDLGQSDMQQNTLFFANYGSGAGNSGTLKTRPSVAHGPLGKYGFMNGGIKTYGARSMKTSIPATSLNWNGLIGKIIEKTERGYRIPALSTLLNYWFRNASKFNEGSITTRQISYARPGMMLLYLPSQHSHIDDPRDIGIYYIDSVEGSGEIGKAGKTTFKVIRGIPIPTDVHGLIYYLMDWEMTTVGKNTFDGEFPL